METFTQQFFNLLISPPGNLIYHLVLAFLVTATIQTALGKHIKAAQQRMRLIIGLSLLLIGQIILFMCSGLAWQGMVNGHTFFPPVDRALAVFSFVWIFWMWAFPNKNRVGDVITWFINLVILILLLLTLGMWTNQQATSAFNTSWWDWFWGLFTIVFSLGGMLYLILRRPSGWVIALVMLCLNLAGYVAHLAFMPANGDYSPLLRLTHICAYPLLPTLAQRLYEFAPPVSISAKTISVVEKPAVKTSQVDFPALRAWVEFTAQDNPQDLCCSFSKALSQSLKVDLTLLLSLDTESTNLKIDCGYNLANNLPFSKLPLDTTQLRILVNSIQRNKIGMIKFDETTKADLQYIAKILELSEPSEIVILPLPPASTKESKALLFLSPMRKRTWSNDELSMLQTLRENLVNLLQPSGTENAQTTPIRDQAPEEMERLQEKIDYLKKKNSQMEGELEQISTDFLIKQQENETLKSKFNQLQQDLLFLSTQINTQESPVEPAVTFNAQTTPSEPEVDIAWLEQAHQENKDLQTELDNITEENDAFKHLFDQFEAQPDTAATPSRDFEWDIPSFTEPPAKEKTQPLKIKKETSLPESKKEITVEETYLRKLQAENENLFSKLRESQQTNSANNASLQNLSTELQQTLEKVSQLEEELTLVNRKIVEYKEQAETNGKSETKFEEIKTLVAELSDPMSSMTGYMDMLLSENIGKLGAVHKRLVERMKATFDRVTELMNQLMSQVTPGMESNNTTTISEEELDISFNQALMDLESKIKEKSISIELNLIKNFVPMMIKISDLYSAARLIILAWLFASRNNSHAEITTDLQDKQGVQQFVIFLKGPISGNIEDENSDLAKLKEYVLPSGGIVTHNQDENGIGTIKVSFPVLE